MATQTVSSSVSATVTGKASGTTTVGSTLQTATTATQPLKGLTGAVAMFFMWILDFLYRFVPYYPVDIMLLTLLVKLIMFPFTYQQVRASVMMTKIQPLVKKIQEKYKDDKNKQGEELMKLYQEYKVNPLMGCLVLIFQLPIFWGLYKALLNYHLYNPNFNGVSFLWVPDISKPDPTWATPIIVAVATYFQFKLSQTPTSDPQTQAQTKMMMILMPLMFAWFAMKMPVGVAIYWVTFAILGVLENRLVRYIVEKEINKKGMEKKDT